MILIETYIPYGKPNAIKREDLCDKANIGDRTLREAIEDARCRGYLICNDQDGQGYYQTSVNDPLYKEHLSKQYKQDYARAMSILKRMKKERQLLKELEK